jgi:hypothetical protein
MTPVDLRDYESWHDAYDDPGSELSWRLGRVRHQLAAAFDALPGERVVLSACAGDGRDVLGMLAGRADAARFRVTLVELLPVLAERARVRAVAAGLSRVDVRQSDAGTTDAYAGAVPADVVVLVGIFGNISDDALRTTVASAPGLCASGAWLVWSRGRDLGTDSEVGNGQVRAWFEEAGFAELAYEEHPDPDASAALGVARYDGPPQALEPGRRLFSFIR